VTDAATLELVKRALAEDIGAGDVTSLATVPAQARHVTGADVLRERALDELECRRVGHRAALALCSR